ncbi:TIGR01906 family membrane protein [Clostridium cadaveris]|uniref:Integral membrane protein TIGR01906 n=1 Tax=Clostridium cadaveris TaxID=1529 RepID=A0A1I2LD62_9CLOT|nr:TIGR01906 family membrane protein [Clostridium cadaveris]NWK09635.1 TIGR01906 family membrane protein [Clostridium cadaveris]PWL52430.1 MAG: TIGR01906 family membrane protein [Clostridium cadaveris]UFH64399.1 TIGR01906 family membrane protein [Clostridium cadaveris]SFF75427.1 integral membrane protein TIGR01906 [Clostridium cadaveris]
MRKSHFFINFIGSLSLVLFICSFSIFSVANTRWIYHRDIDRLNLGESKNISKAEVKQNFEELLYYINHREPEELKLTSFPISPEGSIHFKDTKELFLKNKSLLFISLLSLCICIYFSYMNKRMNFLYYGAFSCLLILVSILLSSLINFDFAFTLFHKILFTNDYWLFSPVFDPVITILPQEFFFHCFIFICAFIILLSLLFIAIGFFINSHLNKKRGCSYRSL